MGEEIDSDLGWAGEDWEPDDQWLTDYIFVPSWQRGETRSWATIGTPEGPRATSSQTGSDRVPVSAVNLAPPHDSRSLVPGDVAAAVDDYSETLRGSEISNIDCHGRCRMVGAAIASALKVAVDRPYGLVPSLALAAASARMAIEQATLIVALDHHGALTHAPDDSWGAPHYYASQLRHTPDKRNAANDLKAAGLPITVNKEGEETPPLHRFSREAHRYLSSDLVNVGDLYSRLSDVQHGSANFLAWFSDLETIMPAYRSIEFDIRLACAISSIAMNAESHHVYPAIPALTPRILGGNPRLS